MTETPPRLKTRSPSPSFLSPVQRFLPRVLFNPSTFSNLKPEWSQSIKTERVAGENLSSIDWHEEYGKERRRMLVLQELKGIRGIFARIWDSTIPWLIVVATGVFTGALAASLDILTAWFTDIRFGACVDIWYMSKDACCKGVDIGEVCHAWKTYAEILGDSSHIITRSLLQYGVYILFAVIFAVSSSILVQVYAPYAFHTGIPEIKTMLGGYIIVDFLSGWTLLTKSVGLPLAVASGLSLGKEGPMVHVACCIGNMMLSPFAVLRGNEARQREILSAAAAAGVSVAFGAPLGGVLFSLEEISTFFPGSTLWQSFVCAIVAAVTLQYIDPYDTGKLVLFQVTTSQVWRGFELVPWLLLGVLGGVFGAVFIKLNQGWETFRRSSGMKNYPVTEVAGLALFTAVVSYLMLFMRIPTAQLVSQLFSDCDKNDQYGLCDSSNPYTIITLLLVTAFAKTLFTVATFGASLPAGIFLPSLAIGALVGRALGIFMDHLHKFYPTAWIFSNCPTEGSCISPPVYAVIGAASACGGVTRMTISLVVILFELTGAVDLVLQLMMSVMVSKFTADYFSSDGVYEMWINIRNYPFLNNKDEYRRDTVVAKDVMTEVKDVIVLTDEGWTVGRIDDLLASEFYRGFPIVKSYENQMILGYVSRIELEAALEYVQATHDVTSKTACYFGSTVPSEVIKKRSSRATSSSINFQEIADPISNKREITTVFESAENPDGHSCGTKDRGIDLRPWIDQAPITLHIDTPMEVVVAMFQRLGLRSILFTKKGGTLGGILTKMDVHAHLRPGHQVSVRRSKSAAATPNIGLRSRKNRTSTWNRSTAGSGFDREESIPLASSVEEVEEEEIAISRNSYGNGNEAQW